MGHCADRGVLCFYRVLKDRCFGLWIYRCGIKGPFIAANGHTWRIALPIGDGIGNGLAKIGFCFVGFDGIGQIGLARAVLGSWRHHALGTDFLGVGAGFKSIYGRRGVINEAVNRSGLQACHLPAHNGFWRGLAAAGILVNALRVGRKVKTGGASGNLVGRHRGGVFGPGVNGVCRGNPCRDFPVLSGAHIKVFANKSRNRSPVRHLIPIKVLLRIHFIACVNGHGFLRIRYHRAVFWVCRRCLEGINCTGRAHPRSLVIGSADEIIGGACCQAADGDGVAACLGPGVRGWCFIRFCIRVI